MCVCVSLSCKNCEKLGMYIQYTPGNERNMTMEEQQFEDASPAKYGEFPLPS